MIFLSILIMLVYSILILFLNNGFSKIHEFISADKANKNTFSIIIPFRNEAQNLPYLLKSISKLCYSNSLFEVLLINDASTDNFKGIISRFQLKNPTIHLQVISNIIKSNSPKKDAIEIGIKIAKNEWIITTDADCILPVNWLKTLDAFIQKENPKMVVAPVIFQSENSFLNRFQVLDFLSLQGSTIGGFGINKPFLCNGANLCYQKVAFAEVNGFSGNKNITSGDDIFILEKMHEKFPTQVLYLKSKEAIVITKAENNFADLLQQRIRWASKTTAYKNPFGKMVGFIVFTTNFYWVALFILLLFYKTSWQHFGLLFLVKFNVDFLLLYKTAAFFKQEKVLKTYLISSVLHPFFTVIVVFLSFQKKIKWKGRAFKK